MYIFLTGTVFSDNKLSEMVGLNCYLCIFEKEDTVLYFKIIF